MKILIVYSSYTGGHASAAKALKATFDTYGTDDATVINTLDYMPTFAQELHRELEISEHEVIRRAVFDKAISGSRTAYNLGRSVVRVKSWFSLKLPRYLKKLNPDIIISTHSHTNVLFSIWKEAGFFETPIVSVLTDYIAHIIWVQPMISYYFVADEDVKKDLISFGVQAKKIFVSGIPVHPKFLTMKEISKNLLKKNLGFRQKLPLINIIGGAHGTIDYEAIVRKLMDSIMDFSIAVICGHNNEVQGRLLKLCSREKDRKIQINGYLEEIPAYFRASDILISKAGGLTTAEALSVGTPLIYIDPLPGLEEIQAQKFSELGAAALARSPEGVSRILDRLLKHPEQLHSMARLARCLGRSQAASEIVSKVKEVPFLG